MGRKCEFCSCPNAIGKSPGKSFHGFPSDPQRCALWVQLCCSEELMQKLRADGVDSLKKLKVCSDHFIDSSFKNIALPSKGLKRNAVPILPGGSSVGEDCKVEGLENAFQMDLDSSHEEVYESAKATQSFFVDNSQDGEPWVVDTLEDSDETNLSVPGLHDVSEGIGLLVDGDEEMFSVPGLRDINEGRDLLVRGQPNEGSSLPEDGDEEMFSVPELRDVNEGRALLEDGDKEMFSVPGLHDVHEGRDLPIRGQPDEGSGQPEDGDEEMFSVPELRDVNEGSAVLEDDDKEMFSVSGLRDVREGRGLPIRGQPNDLCALDDNSACAVDYKKLFHEQKEKALSQKDQIRHLKDALQKAQRKSRWRFKSLVEKKQKICSLKKEVKRLNRENQQYSKLKHQLNKNTVLSNSLMNATRQPKGRRYNQQTRKFVIGAYLAGPSGYRYVQQSKVLTLPSKKSISRWNARVSLKPGLNKEILNRLALKTEKYTKKEKAAILCMDGMSIKPELTYNAKTDTFAGFPDDGKKRKIEKNNPMILATEAVVLMVSGLSHLNSQSISASEDSNNQPTRPTRFKQGIGYLLAHNTLGSECQFRFIEAAVHQLKTCGLYPTALVLDQCTTNVKMVAEAGATKTNPVINIDSTKVAVFFDSPHLLKSARNMLSKHNCVFNGRIASFDYLEELYNIDSVSYPRMAPKLSDTAINLPPFASMNVALAARTLSTSVSDGIEYYVGPKEKLMDRSALPTASFAKFYDDLFDCFNSKSINSSKPYRAALTADSSHWEFLTKAKSVLENSYFTKKTCFNAKKALKESRDLTSKQRKPNYLNGFVGNIHALKWLWDTLFTEFDFDHLCTNFTTQDCLENLFSETRRRCGCNDAPNCYQFSSALKYAAISANEKLPTGSNCEQDEAQPLVLEDDLSEDSAATKVPEYNYKFTQLKPVDVTQYPQRELNGLMYILGAAVRKLPHKMCRKNVTLEREKVCENDSNYRFCLLKNAKVFPSSKLFEIGTIAFTAFKQKFHKFLYQNRCGVKTRLKLYLKYEDFKDFVCQKCFDTIADKVFNTLIQCFLRTVKYSLKQKNAKKRANKRNRKAIRMSLPARSK